MFERCGQQKPTRQPFGSHPSKHVIPPTGSKSFRSLKGGRFLFEKGTQNVINAVGDIVNAVGDAIKAVGNAEWKRGMISDSVGSNIRGIIKEAGGFVDRIIKGKGARSSAESSGSESLESRDSQEGDKSYDVTREQSDEDSYSQSSDHQRNGEASEEVRSREETNGGGSGSLNVDVSNERSAEETGKESYQGSYDEGSSVALGSYDHQGEDSYDYEGSREENGEAGPNEEAQGGSGSQEADISFDKDELYEASNDDVGQWATLKAVGKTPGWG